MTVRTIFLTVCCAAGGLCAQSYQGGIRGVVRDPGGSVIADARISLINQGTNVSRSTLSNGQGEYAFSAIDPATYGLLVEAPGFKKFEQKGIVVGTQEFLTLDPKMEVGAISESIQVNEEVPLIQTANASQG